MTQISSLIGQALRGVRPGLGKLVSAKFRHLPESIRVTSPAMAEDTPMPARFTADGAGLSPPLSWSGVPEGAACLVLLVEDADPPFPQPFVHLVLPGLAFPTGDLAEGAVAVTDDPVAGRNTFRRRGWLPPSPVPGHGPHRYVFQLYALAADPGFVRPPGRAQLVASLRAHGLARGQMTATYERA